MPRMSGFEVLERIDSERQAGKQIPKCFFLLMVTSSNSDKDREQAERYQFVKNYMVKPLDADQFKAVVDEFYK